MKIIYSSSPKNPFSYVGGKPMLPKDVSIPVHPKLNTPLTFYFQIAFPEFHAWYGKLLSVFYVTDDYISGEMTPEMITYNEKNYDVSSKFIESSQKLFKVMVSNVNEVVLYEDYLPVVELNYLDFEVGNQVFDYFGMIDSKPLWLLEDESPATLDSELDFSFLFQTNLDIDFKRTSLSPRQKIEDYENIGKIRDSFSNHYSLFGGNSIFFFGVKEKNIVYLVIQS